MLSAEPESSCDSKRDGVGTPLSLQNVPGTAPQTDGDAKPVAPGPASPAHARETAHEAGSGKLSQGTECSAGGLPSLADLHEAAGPKLRPPWLPRRIALRIASNIWFDRAIIGLILANCVFLGLSDPLDTDPDSTLNRVIDVSDRAFLVAFSVEMGVKLLALGVWGPGSYLWDPWNAIDGILVVGGWITYLPSLQQSNLSAIRVVRVLRPLRTINSIEGLRILIDSLLSALPQLLNVLGLCAFIFFLFGLVGLQIFPGKLSQRCHYPANFNGTTAGPVVFSPLVGELCNMDTTSKFTCPTVMALSVSNTSLPERVELRPVQLLCVATFESQNQGLTNFDNIGTAFLTIFQCITLEGWVDVMYWIEETTTAWTNLYFLLLITFGSLFLLNLIIAAMTINLSVERHLKAKQAQVNQWESLAHGGNVQHAQEATTADVLSAAVMAKYQLQLDEMQDAKDAPSSSGMLFRSRAGMQAEESLRELTAKPAVTDVRSDGNERHATSPPQLDRVESASSLLGTLMARRKRNGDVVDSEPEPVQHSRRGRSLRVAPLPAVQESGGGDVVSRPAFQPATESAAVAPTANVPLEPRPRRLQPLPSSQRNLKLPPPTALTQSPLPVVQSPPLLGSRPAQLRPLSIPSSRASTVAAQELGTAASPSCNPPSKLLGLAGPMQAAAGLSHGKGVRVGGLAVSGTRQSHRPGPVSSRQPMPGTVSVRMPPAPKLNELDECAASAKQSPMNVAADREGVHHDVCTAGRGKRFESPQQHAGSGKEGAVATGASQLEVPDLHRWRPAPQAGWLRHTCFRVVASPTFSLGVMVLIVVNTLLLAVEHHGMEQWLVDMTQVANLILTALFSLEMAIKLVGLGWRGYVHDGFNLFDGFIVLGSWVELGLAIAFEGGSSAVSALRTFRLLRIFKLARSWQSFNVLLATTLRSLPRIGPFSVVLLIFMFIFSLMGMQMFGGKLGTEDQRPRANYDSFLWAFTTTFQVLSGENWNEVMYEAVAAAGWPAALFFVCNVVVGTYIVLNLFLAILIDNFCNNEEEEETAAQARATESTPPATPAATPRPAPSGATPHAGLTSHSSVHHARAVSSRIRNNGGFDVQLLASHTTDSDAAGRMATPLQVPQLPATPPAGAPSLSGHMHAWRQCWTSVRPATVYQRSLARFKAHASYPHRVLCLLHGSNPCRRAAGMVATHPIFDAAIMLLIIISCVMLALDSPSATSALRATLESADFVVTWLFTAEMAMKMVAFGVWAHHGAYFKDPWNWLDFFIVLVSGVDLAVGSGVKVIKVVRLLRALRPLRMVRRLNGLKLVLNAVVGAIPNCIHVAMVAVLFHLIFGILGVNFFGGRFYACTDPSRECLPSLAPDCPEHLACTGSWHPFPGSPAVARAWQNPSYGGRSSYSFDNTGAAMLTLFEVASLELWLDVMYTAADVRGIGWAPRRDSNAGAVFFFMFFIMVASFFILNLFVSVVAENFAKMKKQMDNTNMFMTESQRRWAELQRDLATKKPAKLHAPLPDASYFRVLAFKLVDSSRFELAVLSLIMLNVALMACRWRGEPQSWANAMDAANHAFGLAFLLEAIVKLVGLGRSQYFSSHWNVFDFAIVCMNVAGFTVEVAIGSASGIDFTLLRVVRVIRIFRLVKVSKHLRAIFSTLLISLPSLGNVGALLCMLFFMFAVAGQQLFGSVEHGEFINEHANFEDFRHSILLLFRMSTGESWNGLMHDCVDAAGGFVAYTYFVSFVLLGQFVMLNLFVAVILENFEYEMEAESGDRKVKRQDLDAFAHAWSLVHMELSTTRRVVKRKRAANSHRSGLILRGLARAQVLLGRPQAPPSAPDVVRLDRHWLPALKLRDVLLKLEPPLGLAARKRSLRSYVFKQMLTLAVPINTGGYVSYTQSLHALALRAFGADVASASDNHRLLAKQLEKLTPQMSMFHTGQLFAAQFVQRWYRRRRQQRSSEQARRLDSAMPVASNPIATPRSPVSDGTNAQPAVETPSVEATAGAGTGSTREVGGAVGVTGNTAGGTAPDSR